MNAAILLSRQSLFPSKNSLWVQKVCEAISYIKKENLTLITSVGTQTWELLIVIAKLESVRQIIFISADSMEDFESKKKYYTYEFNLDDNCTAQPILNKIRKDDNIYKNRDSVIIKKADFLIPVSIREKGNMSELLLKTDQKKVIKNFSISYKEENSFKTKNIDILKTKIDINNYIIHWTRQCKQKWPDEKLYDYYLSILQSETYPRSALKTIMHILDVNKIISSNRHLPKNCKCVSFSGAKVEEFEKLMRWRKRYKEMSFEPYGIGIEKKYALLNGIFKVNYVNTKEIKDVVKSEKWKFQSNGKKGNWFLEDEYRYNGDLNISTIPADKLICICKYNNEALIISKKYNIFAYSIYED